MAFQKSKTDDNASYNKLKADLDNGEIGRCYIFHGEEKYLLQHCLTRLRALLCLDGLDGFNYKRFDGSNISGDTLAEAVEILPFAAERTLIEVHDVDLFKCPESLREKICDILKDLPEHVCVVFVFSAIEYSPDKRLKTTKEILKHAQAIEFPVQEETKLAQWIIGHFQRAGKSISRSDAIYLTQLTGGLMTGLHGEIEKVIAYAKHPQVSRSDIDAVVTPTLEVESFRLADAIIKRDGKSAIRILERLIAMREVPHKLMFGISMKMRQLLVARVCIDSGISKARFMSICGIYKDYPADILLGTARRTSLSYCREAVLMCAQTARELNSTNEPEERIIELVARLALL